MTRRLLAILALVAWLSTGCFTMIGMMTDQKPRTSKGRIKPDPSITDSNHGMLVGMALDAAVFGLALYAISHSDLGYGCGDTGCPD